MDLGARRVGIRGDSELVIKQITKEYKCIKENLIMYFFITNQLLKQFNFVDISHVPQAENREANNLEQIASSYKVPKGKLEDLIKVRGRVLATRLSLLDLSTMKLGFVDSKNFEVFTIEHLIDTDW